MTYRIIIIAAAAIAFAWGFSSLVEHKERPIPSDSTHVACSGWSGDNCTRTNIR